MGLLLQEYYAHGPFENALLKVGELCARCVQSIVVLTSDAVWAMRDPWGVRPLCLGKMRKGYVLACESCALLTDRRGVCARSRAWRDSAPR